ncbi:major facilitator superfamily domain-containing protein [Zychaea mexicana]|uniref:major facilitator superfamily domain-containing protein n=1 Tax=Zychaea mexicana TaxID=64656 RepID=UPI0022FEFC1E|nr:major facilitator superfamily domain-containing protein [Zychaea mexicana]KAI9495830.1 major facilitator superfamily domain-containing protein [Zychaea mexicana]
MLLACYCSFRAVAVAGFLANFVMFGIASVWGVLSQAFATSTLEGKASTLELMTVGSLVNVCLNIFSPVSIVLVRFGTRFNYALGSVIMCLAIILSGFATEVWHLYLSQGLLYGFGASFLYMSIASVIPQWFTTRRATAMGLCSSGTGLGGLALSPMTNYLLEKYGILWAYCILGFFSLGICAVGTILIKDRMPSAYRKQMPIKSPIDWSMFKMTDLNVWLVGSVVGLMGYLGPVFYLPSKFTENAIGRIALGYVADKIGRLNMFIICSALSSIFSFVIWPFADSFEILLVFCILWGTTCGMYYGLAAPITASVVGMEKLSSGLSIVFIVSAIAAMGTPISAAIQQSTPDHGYLGIQMFTGAVYIAGALICIYLKLRLTGGSLFKKY